jgi:hypothetical protein
MNMTLVVQPVPDASSPSASQPPLYFKPWADEDANQQFLAQRSKGLPPRYVTIRIENVQASPHGVAGSVKISAMLAFGAPDDVAPHPYNISRLVNQDVILASRYVEGPIFNVAGLENWVVVLSKVEYRDIMKRPRTAAVGTGLLQCTVSGNMISTIKVFEPRKGGFTDAD